MIEARRERFRIRSCRMALLLLLLMAAAGWMGRAAAQGEESGPGLSPSERAAMSPSTHFAPLIQAGADSIHVWVRATRPRAADRAFLYAAVRRLLNQNQRFEERIARTYPRDYVEWLLITDGMADTLAQLAGPLLRSYVKANPREILTEGRQQLELTLSRITGPPARMLGFHVVKLANFACSKADSILGAGLTTDRPGVEDGVLRTMDDWCQLYSQVHNDPINVYQCRLSQEDWIIVRFKDRCGHSGGSTWKLGEQWMAVVDRDTTVTPPLERYAHELHLRAVNCPGDSAVIYVDLPNFREMQMEVLRRQREGTLESPNPPGGP